MKEKKLKISVALCTYNGEKYIKEQLQSIFQQKLPVSEIIICDDGSNDNTVTIVKDYQKKFPDLIQLYQNKITLKVVKNFEKAISFCTGDYIFLSDQDDIWFPEKTEKIAYYFNENPNKNAVFHNLKLLSDKVENKTMWESIYFNPKVVDEELLYHTIILLRNVVTGAAFALRNNKKHRFVDESEFFLHDYQLAVKFAQNYSLGILNECLGYYRLHENQQVGTTTVKNEYFEEIYNLLTSPLKSNYKLKLFWNELPGFYEDLDKYQINNEERKRLYKNYIYRYRNEFLNSISFLEQKKTVFLWWKKNLYYIGFFDLFKNKF